MGYEVVRQVLERSSARQGARMVLTVLADRADAKSGECFPSMDTISAEAGISKRQAIRCVQKLVNLGEVSIAEKGGGRGNRTTYRVTLGDVGVTVSETQRVTSATIKGDIRDIERVTSATPHKDEPSEENHQEPSSKMPATSAARDNRGKSRASKPKKPRSPKRTSAPKKRAPDPYGLPAQELATHLHDEYRRVYDQEQDPLTEAFGTSIGHAKRLLRLKYPTGPPAKLNGEKGVLTWWLEHWNEGREGSEFELHDFSMQKFVAKFTGISNRMEVWADARKARKRTR